MKFELCGKTKAKLVKVDIQSAKRGQTDVVPAVALTFKIALGNVADGMAYLVDESRAHQLRQVGNGVVALQAAVAVVQLLRRAGFA